MGVSSLCTYHESECENFETLPTFTTMDKSGNIGELVASPRCETNVCSEHFNTKRCTSKIIISMYVNTTLVDCKKLILKMS